jgi:chitodextrinase
VLEENWSFGDSSSAVGTNASHAWTKAGSYTITLDCEDELGATAAAEIGVTVHPSLTASFVSLNGTSANPAFPATPVILESSVSGGTSPYIVEWTFGDGSSGTGLSVSHSYAGVGTYTVEATLSDAVGASVRANLTVTINSSPTSSSLPSLTGGFASGAFLGLLLGGVAAAVVLFAVGCSEHQQAPAPPPDTMPGLLNELTELVEELSPASRAVLLLHYVQDLSLDEVAAVLELSPGTVKSRLAYGLACLRKSMERKK